MSYTAEEIRQKSDVDVAEGNDISIQEVMRIALRRKWGIITIVVASILMSVIIFFSQTPTYYAASVLMIQSEKESSDITDALGFNFGSDSKSAKKDIELLKSIPISEMTVKALWNSTKADSLEFFGNRPYISPVRQMFGWLVPIPANTQNRQRLIPGTPLYNATMRFYAQRLNARIKVDGSRETNIIKVSVASPFADEAVVLTNALCNLYKQHDIKQKTESYIQSSHYVDEMIKDQEQQLEKADAALSEYMVENGIFDVSGNTARILGRIFDIDTRYNEIMTEYRITLNAREFIESKLSDNDRQVSNRISKTVDATLGAINDEIRTKESEYVNLLKAKPVDDPEVIKIKQHIDQIKSRYENISKSKIAGEIKYIGQSQKYKFDLIAEKLQLEQKLNLLNYTAQEHKKLKLFYEKQLENLPDKEQHFVRLQRERDIFDKTYLFLKQKLNENRLLLGSEVGNVSIIGSAFKPFSPDSPDIKKNILFGLLSGVLLAGVYAFTAEKIDDRINYDPLFFKGLGFNIWGIIPLIPSFNKATQIGTIGHMYSRIVDRLNNLAGKKKEQAIAISAEKETSISEDSYPMMTDKLNSSFAESFRALRTNLAFARIDQSLKTLLISGCSIGEGKTTISANLGMAWGLADKKTLVIDADLRRPAQHKMFKKTRALGLADCLVNNDLEVIDNYIQKTHVDNLFLMSAGSPVPNPNELLGSDRMRKLLYKLEEQYERIIIDSPPVFISDAAQLINMVDGVLITVRLGYSSKFTLKQYAYDSFIHSHIVGVVIIDNDRPARGLGKGYGSYGYSRYGYGEYGDSYSDRKI